jgi:hypothetical protein
MPLLQNELCSRNMISGEPGIAQPALAEPRRLSHSALWPETLKVGQRVRLHDLDDDQDHRPDDDCPLRLVLELPYNHGAFDHCVALLGNFEHYTAEELDCRWVRPGDITRQVLSDLSCRHQPWTGRTVRHFVTAA